MKIRHYRCFKRGDKVLLTNYPEPKAAIVSRQCHLDPRYWIVIREGRAEKVKEKYIVRI